MRGLPVRLKLSLLVDLYHLSLEAAAADVGTRIPQQLLLAGALLVNEHLVVLITTKATECSVPSDESLYHIDY